MSFCIFISNRLPTFPAFEFVFVEHVHNKPVDFDWDVVRSAVRTVFFCYRPVIDALDTVKLVALAALLWILHNLGTYLANKLFIKNAVYALIRVYLCLNLLKDSFNLGLCLNGVEFYR